jgi:hypothetical protein
MLRIDKSVSRFAGMYLQIWFTKRAAGAIVVPSGTPQLGRRGDYVTA